MPAKILCIHERIAVVNGEPDIHNALKKGLKRHGFAVDTFNDPHAALASFQSKYYDLMIIDIRMHTIIGFDLYRQLKRMTPASKSAF
jgi:DNA-binding response OmpR family regulator